MADNKYGKKSVGGATQEQRMAAIEKAETERLRIIASLEEKMKEYAKATGKKSLTRRKAPVGKAPNDWKKNGKL